jgi:predicted negative regulator of RcsB-dependent stress response
MARIGDILNRRGDPAKARDLWEEARPLFARSSQAKQVTAMDERLAAVA